MKDQQHVRYRRVLVEVLGLPLVPGDLRTVRRRLARYGFEMDGAYGVVPLGDPPSSYCLRGTVPEPRIHELESAKDVVAVWDDALVAPFGGGQEALF